MKRLSAAIIAAIFVLAASSAHAGLWGTRAYDDDLSDRRTFSSYEYQPDESQGGLQGSWTGGFSIEWDVTYDPSSGFWSYEYVLSSARKSVSHFILEMTEGEGDIQNPLMKIGDGEWESIDIEGPRTWGTSRGNSSPGWHDGVEIYGIKFDEGSRTVSYSFETMSAPVWGNFYAKGGRDQYVYNDALAFDHFASDDKLHFIVRPDGHGAPPVVPEPASSVLFVTGSAVFLYRRFFKKQ